MRADPSRLIQIKDDDDEKDQCNNRIYFLRAQRLCERNAKKCREVCQACENHGDQRFKNQHLKIPLDKFLESFEKLETTCSRQTEHYVRQMNQAEIKAIEAIAKKKEEYLKEIEQVKTHMMKKTYRTLEEKYTSLYEKYKNQRYDLLKCCEVFWVLNAQVSTHSIKHSEINKKLEAILKKFESFREVSKNLPTENIFNVKQKIKKTKISQKMGAMSEMRSDPVHLEKVNFDNENLEKYRREVNKFNEELRELKSRIHQRQQELDKVEVKLKQRLNKLNLQKQRLGISSQLVNIDISNKTDHPNMKQLQRDANQRLASPPPPPSSHSASNPPPPIASQIRESRNNLILNDWLHQEIQKRLKQQNEVLNIQPDKNIERQMNQGAQQGVQQHENLNKQDPSNVIVSQNQNIQKASVPPEKAAQVKIQAVQLEPFIEWQNSELVQDIRKYGSNISDGLKVQEIDRLRTFTYVKAPKTTVRINNNLLKKPQSLAKNQRFSSPQQKKVTPLNQLALMLFSKHEMKKSAEGQKSNITEKSQKKPQNAIQS